MAEPETVEFFRNQFLKSVSVAEIAAADDADFGEVDGNPQFLILIQALENATGIQLSPVILPNM